MSKGLGRAVVPAQPPQPTASPMAEPIQKLSPVVRYESAGWQRIPGGHGAERITVTATFADGSTREESAEMTYPPNEREGLLERGLSGSATAKDARRLREIRDRRARLKEQVYARLQRAYG